MSAAQDMMKSVMLAVSAAGTSIWRNNVAVGVVGNTTTWIKGGVQTVTVRPGDAVVRGARVLHAGLFEGSGDCIGASPLVITPEMVGRTVAVFTSLEVKSGSGRPEPAQVRWYEHVRRIGGIAGVVRSPEEAVNLIREFKGRE